MTVGLQRRTVTVLAVVAGPVLVIIACFAAAGSVWTLATAALGLLQLQVIATVLLAGRRPAPHQLQVPAASPAADAVGQRLEVLCTRLLAEVARHRSELRDLREEVAGLGPVGSSRRRDPAS